MEAPKAIDILSSDLTYTYPAKFTELQQACLLGKEALKRLQTMRSYHIAQALLPLPHETRTPIPPISDEDKQRLLSSPLVRPEA